MTFRFEPLHAVAFVLGGVAAISAAGWRVLHVPKRKA